MGERLVGATGEDEHPGQPDVGVCGKVVVPAASAGRDRGDEIGLGQGDLAERSTGSPEHAEAAAQHRQVAGGPGPAANVRGRAGDPLRVSLHVPLAARRARPCRDRREPTTEVAYGIACGAAATAPAPRRVGAGRRYSPTNSAFSVMGVAASALLTGQLTLAPSAASCELLAR